MTIKECPSCGCTRLHRAYMLYPIFKGAYCWECGEFIALWGTVTNWLMEWFIAPFADHFPIAVSDERIGGDE